jgi:hypothetical protein
MLCTRMFRPVSWIIASPVRGVGDTGRRGQPARRGVRALRFGAGAGGHGRQHRGRLEPRWRHRPAGAAGASACRQRGVPRAYRYLAAVLETLAADGLGEGSKVLIMHVDTAFGREVAEGAAAARRLPTSLRSRIRPGGCRK